MKIFLLKQVRPPVWVLGGMGHETHAVGQARDRPPGFRFCLDREMLLGGRGRRSPDGLSLDSNGVSAAGYRPLIRKDPPPRPQARKAGSSPLTGGRGSTLEVPRPRTSGPDTGLRSGLENSSLQPAPAEWARGLRARVESARVYLNCTSTRE